MPGYGGCQLKIASKPTTWIARGCFFPSTLPKQKQQQWLNKAESNLARHKPWAAELPLSVLPLAIGGSRASSFLVGRGTTGGLNPLFGLAKGSPKRKTTGFWAVQPENNTTPHVTPFLVVFKGTIWGSNLEKRHNRNVLTCLDWSLVFSQSQLSVFGSSAEKWFAPRSHAKLQLPGVWKTSGLLGSVF